MLSNPAFAEPNWIKYKEDPDKTRFFYDANSIIEENGNKKVWTTISAISKEQLNKLVKLGNELKIKPDLSKTTSTDYHVLLSCRTREIKVLNTYYYDKRGKLIYRLDFPPSVEMSPIAPGSGHEILYEIICTITK